MKRQPSESAPRPYLMHLGCLLVIGLLGYVIYQGTLGTTESQEKGSSTSWVLDDEAAILENPHIRVTELSLDQLANAATGRNPANRVNRRPVAYLSFGLNYYFGEYNIRGYRLVNIIIHLINGALVYFLALFTFQQLSKINQNRAADRNPQLNIWLALFAGCLFVAHPLQTQAVTYVVQRMTSLATLFYLAAMLCYVIGRMSETTRRRAILWGVGVGCWLLALSTKEIAATLPLVVLLYEWYFFQDLDRDWLKRCSKVYLAPAVIAVGLVGMTYYAFNPVGVITTNYEQRDFTITERLLTQPRVVMLYLSQVAYPAPSQLNLLHHVETSTSLVSPKQTILAIGAIAGLLALAIYFARRQRLLSFCILWFFIHLAIESSFLPLEMVFEHRVYLPMFGAAMLVAYGLFALVKQQQAWAVVVAVLAILLLGASTQKRNEAWQDIFADVVDKNPLSKRAYVGLGRNFIKANNMPLALTAYDDAIRVDPDYVEAYIGKGNVFQKMRDFDEAIQMFDLALAKTKNSRQSYLAHINRGRSHLFNEQIGKAIQDFNLAKQANPQGPEAPHGLGGVYMRLEEFDRALDEYNQAIENDPQFDNAYFGRGNAKMMTGRMPGAIRDFDRVIELNPAISMAYFKRGEAQLKMADRNLLEPAIEDLSKFIEASPGDGQGYYLRGKARIALRQYGAAIDDFTKGIRFGRTFQPMRIELARLLATCPDPAFRKLPQAVKIAENGCNKSDYKDPNWLNMLILIYIVSDRMADAENTILRAPKELQPQLRAQMKRYAQQAARG